MYCTKNFSGFFFCGLDRIKKLPVIFAQNKNPPGEKGTPGYPLGITPAALCAVSFVPAAFTVLTWCDCKYTRGKLWMGVTCRIEIVR